MSPFIRCSVILVVATLCAAAFADVPDIRIDCWTDGGLANTFWPTGTANGDGTYHYSGTFEDADGHWVLNLQDMLVKPDPYVNAVYGLTNNAGTTQNFTLVVSIPVTPQITPSSLMGGSTAGSVNDANFDGIGTVSTIAPSPFYMGTIDGVGVLPLHADPFSVSVPFAGGTANIPAVSAGLPGPTLPGPAVLTDIGITHRFSLTAHDTIGITSFFVVIPEPASALLLGVLALVCRRR